MLYWYHPSRPLRSGAYPSLVPNKNKTVLWNNLPVHLRCAESVVVFKKTIKYSSVLSSVNQFLSDC